MSVPISFCRQGDKLHLYNIVDVLCALPISVRYVNEQTGRMVLYLPSRSIRMSGVPSRTAPKWMVVQLSSGDFMEGKFKMLSSLEPGSKWKSVENALTWIADQSEEDCARVGD